MHNVRFIARLDVKGDKLIKSIQLEGVRVVGDPKRSAREYYEQGADEIILMDAVASLYGRNHLAEVVRYTSENVCSLICSFRQTSFTGTPPSTCRSANAIYSSVNRVRFIVDRPRNRDRNLPDRLTLGVDQDSALSRVVSAASAV